jgi:hypothetical protein
MDSSFVVSADDCDFGNAMGSCNAFCTDDNDDVNDDSGGTFFLFGHHDGFSHDVVITSADGQDTRHVDGQPSLSVGLHDIVNTSADEQDTWQDEGHGDDIRGDEHPSLSFETDPSDQSGPPVPDTERHQSPAAGAEGSQAPEPLAGGDGSLSSQPQPPALAPSDLPRVTRKVCQLVSGIAACSPCMHARVDVYLFHHTLLNVE